MPVRIKDGCNRWDSLFTPVFAPDSLYAGPTGLRLHSNMVYQALPARSELTRPSFAILSEHAQQGVLHVQPSRL